MFVPDKSFAKTLKKLNHLTMQENTEKYRHWWVPSTNTLIITETELRKFLNHPLLPLLVVMLMVVFCMSGNGCILY